MLLFWSVTTGCFRRCNCHFSLRMRRMKRAIEQCLEQHRQRPVRFIRDPAGIVVACFTWSIIIASTTGIWISLITWLGPYSLWGSLEGMILTASVGMCAWSHYMTMTTEPGFVPLKKKRDESKVYGTTQADSSNEEDCSESDLEEEDIEMPLDEFENREDDGSLHIFCDDCNMYRPTRAMHCHTCERCVVLMDHHCPWVNNCVGVGNQKYFLLFLFYVAVTSVHVLLLVVFQRVICSSGQAFCGFDAGKFPGQLGMYLVAASCTFGLFCIVMLVMEIHSIDDDPIYSNIAKQLHVRTGCKSKSRAERHLSVIFRTNGFDWTWLLPLPIRRNRQDWQIIGGFSSGGGGDNSVEEVCR